MRIGLVNKFYPPVIGGVEYHVRVLAENLEMYEDIDRIEIIVANTENVLKKEKISEKIYVTRLPNWGTVASTPIAPSFVTELNKIDVDLLHFHFPYPFGDFSWLLSNNKKPFVITYHSDILRQRFLNQLYVPIRNMFFSKAARIFATSPNIVKSSSTLIHYQKKVKVVPLGISPDKYFLQESINESIKIKQRYLTPIVLFVGRFVYYKGAEILIESFKDINGTLIMIGKGPLHKKLKKMIDEYNLQKKVYIYSDVNDFELTAYFNACDIFVLPSIANTEAYGLVQLEAQACGKPVISTDLPTGVPFVNKHMETGLVVEPGSVEDLNQSIKVLINNKKLRVELGRNAQVRMLRDFTDVKMAKSVYDNYLEVLKNDVHGKK